ncbi:hypothetical protein BS17DRAFT_33093 [Gyrodon lividus]|nr:hypothetical protein BS17DRAFT_33093 [Gyrodon lividus]
MLKRQRPATPPPSSLDDSPPCFPDRSIRPLPQRNVDPTLCNEPRSKRQRVQPPVLDGALRGWLASNPTGPYVDESDGEEDWVEDGEGQQSGGLSSLPLAVTDQYKHANSLLHELHTLHQHRFLFAESARDERLNQYWPLEIPPSTIYAQHPHLHAHPLGQGHGTGNLSSLSQSTDGKISSPELSHRPMPSFSSQSTHITSAEGEYVTQPSQNQVDVHEVQSVRERYEDANRYDLSLREYNLSGHVETLLSDSWVRYFFHAGVSLRGLSPRQPMAFQAVIIVDSCIFRYPFAIMSYLGTHSYYSSHARCPGAIPCLLYISHARASASYAYCHIVSYSHHLYHSNAELDLYIHFMFYLCFMMR